ncbi:MAG: hypothetical protein IRY92_05110, partial [Dactylosporangium sp.]|nr:hypothetical protein [Dactylosporangium sp.]
MTPPSSAPPGGTAGTAGREDGLPQTVASLTSAELEPAQRRSLLGRLAGQVRAGLGRTLHP